MFLAHTKHHYVQNKLVNTFRWPKFVESKSTKQDKMEHKFWITACHNTTSRKIGEMSAVLPWQWDNKRQMKAN